MFRRRRGYGQRHFRTGIEPADRNAVPRLTGRSRCTPTGSRRLYSKAQRSGRRDSALIGRVRVRQWAHAGPSRGDAVAFTLPGSLQVRYLRVVIVTM